VDASAASRTREASPNYSGVDAMNLNIEQPVAFFLFL
jgi:hypothetical protein